MAEFQSTSSLGTFPEVAENLVARTVKSYLNDLREGQMAKHLGANYSERTEERTEYRNGTRERLLYTRVEPVTLRVPQARGGGLLPIFAKRTGC